MSHEQERIRERKAYFDDLRNQGYSLSEANIAAHYYFPLYADPPEEPLT